MKHNIDLFDFCKKVPANRAGTFKTWPARVENHPPGPVKYDIVHMRDQAFSKQPQSEFGSLPKNNP